MTSIPDPSEQPADLQSSSPEKKTEDLPQTSNQKNKFSNWLLAVLLLGGVGIALWQVLTPDSVPVAQTVAETPAPKAVTTIALASGTADRQIRLLGDRQKQEKARRLALKLTLHYREFS